MNRQQREKKKVRRVIILCGIVTSACLMLAISISYYGSGLDEDANLLRMQRASMDATNTQILQKYDAGQKTIATFRQINPADNPMFGTLDRKNASLLLESLNQRYRLSKLSLDISPVVVQNVPPYQRKTGGVNTSTVKISFESMTDEFAYSVMRDIIASFPGFFHVTLVNLTKNGSIDDEILYDVQNGEIPPKVKCEFAFDWLGLDIKNDDATAPPPAAQ